MVLIQNGKGNNSRAGSYSHEIGPSRMWRGVCNVFDWRYLMNAEAICHLNGCNKERTQDNCSDCRHTRELFPNYTD
jgi:predicted sulfurtransferase